MLLECLLGVIEQLVDARHQVGRPLLQFSTDELATIGASLDLRLEPREQSQAQPEQVSLAPGLRLGLRGELRNDLVGLLHAHVEEPAGDLIDLADIEGHVVPLELPHQLVDDPEEQLGKAAVGIQRLIDKYVQRCEPVGDLALEAQELGRLAAATAAGEGDLGEVVPARVMLGEAEFQEVELVPGTAASLGEVHVAWVAPFERLDVDDPGDLRECPRLRRLVHGCTCGFEPAVDGPHSGPYGKRSIQPLTTAKIRGRRG